MPIPVRRSIKAQETLVLRALNPESLSGIPPTIGVLTRPITPIPTVRGPAMYGALQQPTSLSWTISRATMTLILKTPRATGYLTRG